MQCICVYPLSSIKTKEAKLEGVIPRLIGSSLRPSLKCLLASELIRALAMVSEFAFVAWRNNFLRTDTRVNNKGMG